jgi:hypothetical protein
MNESDQSLATPWEAADAERKYRKPEELLAEAERMLSKTYWRHDPNIYTAMLCLIKAMQAFIEQSKDDGR